MSERDRKLSMVAGVMIVLAVGVLIGWGFGDDDADAGRTAAAERTTASEMDGGQQPAQEGQGIGPRLDPDRLTPEEPSEDRQEEPVVKKPKRPRHGHKPRNKAADHESQADDAKPRTADPLGPTDL